MSKSELKIKAQKLRRDGMTYSEVLKIIPVAKSTISLWLREVGLSKKQKQHITQKRVDAQRKGANAQRNKRIKRQNFLIDNAKNEIGKISKRELWLIGTALYWAEGAKEKEYKAGSGTSFSNSDPKMLKLFITWLKECANVPSRDISADLYIHESHRENVPIILEKWSKILKQPPTFFKHVYFKRNKINTKRRNTGDLYIGLLRVNIRSSSDLNRTIQGWVKGVCSNCGIV